jgi:hypothetical protein
MNNAEQIVDLLPLILPLIIVQLALQIGALISLLRRPVENLRWHNKLVWALIIVLGEAIGSIVYFVVGRVEEEEDERTGD